MSVSTKTRSAKSAQVGYTGDHSGSKGQLDDRGYRVIPIIEQHGVVRPDELYTLEGFKQRLGISSSTMRAARRSGLRVLYRHKHAYVYGRDWINYVLHPPGEAGQAVRS